MVAILGLAVAAALVAVGAYVVNFHGYAIADEPDKWGQFGDFLGGALNPVFGFLSVLALLVALVLQNRELRLTKEELQKSSQALLGQNRAIENQRFEQTFFAWLSNYQQLLQMVTSVGQLDRVPVHGRSALFRWWSPAEVPWVIGIYDLVREAHSAAGTSESDWFNNLPADETQRVRAAIAFVPDRILGVTLATWGTTYRDHEFQLDSLFRSLYRLILWIDSQHEEQLTAAQKWLYVGIVRSQLSWIELVYLFYNGLTERGAKFRRLVNKYALFDNLTFENDPVLEYVRHHQPPAVAYEERAFSSLLARRALGLSDTAEEAAARAAADGR